MVYVLARAFSLAPEQSATAGVAVLCATWWVTLPVPIPVTSLVPFAALPLLGVLDHAKVAQSYGHTLVLLLMAGFMLSMAIEACGAHRRLAVGMVRVVSGGGQHVSARRLLLGFMVAGAFASMWISNTAATLILLPIAIAASEGPEHAELRPRLLLGVAYACSIGGIGTPIGTPSNLLFMAAHEELGQAAWSFMEWMKIGVPVVLAMLPVTYLILSRGLSRAELPPVRALPPASAREVRVLVVFSLIALGWITRVEPFGGWSGWLGLEGVGDATVAFVGLIVILVLPDGKGEPLLSFSEAEKIPWGILLLFGGGIALAAGFEASGLSATLGRGLTGLASAPEIVMIAGICLGVTFLTELTSNTATTALLMPILGAAALAAGLAPAKLMIPAALSASCAFMLPVATPPNAIVFGSGHVPAGLMSRSGLILNLTGTLVITVLCATLL